MVQSSSVMAEGLDYRQRQQQLERLKEQNVK